ncbi:MAG TPA: YceI family protein [Rhizomicrobium sp.]
MRRFAVFLAIAAGICAGAQAAVTTDAKQAPAGAYQVETRHTQVLFAIAHLELTDYHGRFEKVSGTLNFNPNAPEKSSLSVTVDTASANVMSSELLGEIVGADVLDAAAFPTATFTSTAIERTGPTSGRMTGELTLHGVTRPVAFDVTFNGGAQSPMGAATYLLGFRATTVIHRGDFGLDKMRWTGFVGGDVTLTIEALFQKQKG